MQAMRAFTRDYAPPTILVAKRKSTIEVVREIPSRSFDHNVGDPKVTPQHNVGECGCGACGARAKIAMPISYPAAMIAGQGEKGAVLPGYTVTPYDDELADQACMTPVSSGAPVTIAANASAVLTIGPTRGMLDMFYIKIVGLDPATGLEVDPASYRLTPPRVADCPQPCDNTAMRGAFYRGSGDSCLGCRWRAVVGRNADGEAMTFTITNDGVASANFQAVARGYCVARDLCLPTRG